MENTKNVLTISEIATLLRCSRAHVQKALVGRVARVPQLAHVTMGRRKLVRKEWLDQWMEEGKTGKSDFVAGARNDESTAKPNQHDTPVDGQ